VILPQKIKTGNKNADGKEKENRNVWKMNIKDAKTVEIKTKKK
jgi:hypothetical protein